MNTHVWTLMFEYSCSNGLYYFQPTRLFCMFIIFEQVGIVWTCLFFSSNIPVWTLIFEYLCFFLFFEYSCLNAYVQITYIQMGYIIYFQPTRLFCIFIIFEEVEIVWTCLFFFFEYSCSNTYVWILTLKWVIIFSTNNFWTYKIWWVLGPHPLDGKMKQSKGFQ